MNANTALSKVDKRLTVRDLSPDQAAAYDEIMRWLRRGSSPILTLGGVAGSGKSSLLGIIAKEAPKPIAFAAFTGKAANVLSRKLRAVGITTTNEFCPKGEDFGSVPYCGTIHSLIYQPVSIFRCTRCKMEYSERQDCTTQENDSLCRGLVKESGEVRGWKKRDKLDREYRLIAIDEASMVSDDMLLDLRRFNVPILAVGDHAQLPPVNGMGALMQNPDIRLEKIHRQAEGNPIIALSKTIRETGRLDRKYADGKHIIFDSIKNLQRYVRDTYTNVEPNQLFDLGMLCYTNARRVSLNALAREARGLSHRPQKGDQVICLKNQNDNGVFNGMRALIVSDVTKRVEEGCPPWQFFAELDFVDDGQGGEFTMCVDQFNRPYTFRGFDELYNERKINAETWEEVGGLFDFGYALTVHKSQGSSFSDVILVLDNFGRMGAEEIKRFLYTAVTRSSNRLVILS